MNREIEFRAWINHKKQMISDRYFDIDTWQNVIILKDSGASFSYNGSVKSCELMQYIGLKDKKNKKIFEGDFDRKYGVIKYFACEFVFENKDGFTCPAGCNDIEIIGNIFENPELINK